MIIDSPIVSGSSAASGSLNQIGNVTITGSLNVTGDIVGNVSGLAASASYSLSSSYAVTASSADDLLVRGVLTAQTLVVQTITSSVDFVTGSTRFGTIIDNTHQFTGSVGISGSLDVNNSSVITSAQTSSLSALSASYAATASYALNVPVTSAYADNANSSSYAFSASYAATASYAANVPETASYALQALTSSYALTASYISGSGMGVGFPYSGAAVITGSLQITNLTGSGVRYIVADADGNMTAQSASAAIKTTQEVISTAGQTSFDITNGYTTGLVDVFINGTKLSAGEFADTTGTVITLATGSNDGDVVEFVKYLPASGVSNNVLRQLTSFTATEGQTVFSASYTPGLLDVYYNGARLTSTDYTANNGVSIALATASLDGDLLDVMVYSYQVGAMSGIGGSGVDGQVAYYGTTNSITGSPNFSILGNTMNVTGSLVVSGSGTFVNIGPAVFSGSVTAVGGFSGSFSGTATSASYAATASSADSLLVRGTLTAQTLVVQTITSSVDFVTGSTRFGTVSGNTHEFTGSMSVSGSVGIGTSSLTGFSLYVLKNITGATNSYGIAQGGVVQSDVTNSANGYLNNATTAAASFTLTTYRHFWANQGSIGAGSSITSQYGFLAGNTLIGATNNYGFYGDIPAGTNRWNLFMNGTANNYMAGSLGIGTTNLTGINLAINKTITGGTTAYGVYQSATVQSDVTSQAYAFRSNISTLATAFTLGNLYHFAATNLSVGAGSTVTNNIGFWAASTLVGATNNIGFQGSLAAATNTWNLYMAGTAANYMAGKLLIGTTTTSAFALDVNGTARVSGAASFSNRVQVSGNTGPATGAGLELYYNGTAAGTVGYSRTAAAFIPNSMDGSILQFYTSSNERLRLKATGQMRFVPLASDPSGAEAGDIYYNSTISALKLYDGTQWRTITVI